MLTSDSAGIQKFILDRITQIHDEILVHDPEKREDKEYYIREHLPLKTWIFPGMRFIRPIRASGRSPSNRRWGKWAAIITRERLPGDFTEYERLAGIYLIG